jgi:hypothetical protein
MRNSFATMLLLSVVAGAEVHAGGGSGWLEVRRADAERQVSDLLRQNTSAAMWIWSDRYVYRPGEPLSLRWTIKPNNDLYPYTIVAYRLNNQTGAKSFLPNGTNEPTDIFGQNLTQGFRIVRLPEATKGLLVGAGGTVMGQPLTLPNELGMHTMVVELRDFNGGRVIKSSYWKFGVVEQFEDLQGNIDGDRTLVNTRAYRLRGVVAVRNNATLTVQPGTFVFGQTGSQPPSVLLITRNGRINASGTRSRPIIFTSREPESPIGTRQRGDWGGILLLGQAPGNVPAEQSFVEGLQQSDDTRWGGTDANHNCGTMRYVRSEYAGVQLAPNNETNAFVWSGCGRLTVAENLQAHYGNDDSFEWFGGTVNGKYLVATYGEDDLFDFQLGWTGNVQYALGFQNPSDRGNRGIEGDNSEFNNTAEPFSNPTLYNITLVGSGQPGSSETNSPGIYLRRGARATMNNAVVTNWSSPGLHIDGSATQANIDNNTIQMNGVLLWRNNLGAQVDNTLAGQVAPADLTFAQGTRGQGRNFMSADPMLRRPLEHNDPDFRPAIGSPIFRALWLAPPDNGFFDQKGDFAGAFEEVDWTEEWVNFHVEQDVAP